LIKKAQLREACLTLIDEKRVTLEKQLARLQAAQQGETKSSAGDKHETSREMTAQEVGKIDQALAGLSQTQHALNNVNIESETTVVRSGSLIETATMYVFIAAPLGKVNVGNEAVMVISAAAPLAASFLGKKVGDQVSFNGITHHIRAVH